MCRYELTAVVRAESILLPSVGNAQHLNLNPEGMCHFDHPPSTIVSFQTASTRQQRQESKERSLLTIATGLFQSTAMLPADPHLPLYPHAQTDLYPLPPTQKHICMRKSLPVSALF